MTIPLSRPPVDDEVKQAVLAAIEAGQLRRERLEHAHKLEREILHQQTRVDARLRQAEQKRFKVRTRASRAGMRLKGRE